MKCIVYVYSNNIFTIYYLQSLSEEADLMRKEYQRMPKVCIYITLIYFRLMLLLSLI